MERTRGLLFAAGLFSFACGRSQVPPLPTIDTSGFAAPVRDVIDSAQAAARRAPDDANTVARFCMVLQAHEQNATAAACYARALQLKPGSEWSYARGVALMAGGKYAEAIPAFQAAAGYPPAQLKLAEALLLNGQDKDSEPEYRKNPENPTAVFGLGRALASQGRTDEARAQFEKALELFPQYGAAMFALSQNYRRSGDKVKADALLARYPAVKTTVPQIDDPVMAEIERLNAGAMPLLRQAQDAERQGALDAALNLSERAVSIDPKLEQGWINLISLYGRAGRAAEAEAAYGKAIALNASLPEAHYNFSVLAVNRRRFPDAKAALAKAIALNPRHAEALNNMGSILQGEGRLADAQSHFERAVEAQPTFRLAHFHLGRLYANQRRYPQAIAEFERTLSPEDDATPTYLYALGATQARAGLREESRASLTRAHQLAVTRGQVPLAASIERDLVKLR